MKKEKNSWSKGGKVIQTDFNSFFQKKRMRKGQPERLSKLQRVILEELHNNRANEEPWFKYRSIKESVARKYGVELSPKFDVVFSNSLKNLEKKDLIYRGTQFHTTKFKLTDNGEILLNRLFSKN